MTTILIIEDDASIRHNIAEILTYEGYQTLEAENGRAGVEAALNHQPDLIICDVMMPELDGYGVLLEVRADPQTAALPFIFLTARADRSDMRKGMELGANDYLTKPFAPPELVAAVNAALERQQAIRREYDQKLDEMRENLLQSLPHELRTPLTSIIGFGEMLMLDYDVLERPQIHSMAQMIVRAGNRLHRLIENYLLYAQIEIMKTDPERIRKMRMGRVAAASDLIAQLALNKAADAERESDLRVEAEPASLAVWEDSLKKMVEEVVDNALKFSRPGTPVEVRAGLADGWYNLVVSDAGRGMTPAQVKSISAYMQFERKLYEQQGMGLGLAIARNLAELYGGQLNIQSQPDVGTEVHIMLPTTRA